MITYLEVHFNNKSSIYS